MASTRGGIYPTLWVYPAPRYPTPWYSLPTGYATPGHLNFWVQPTTPGCILPLKGHGARDVLPPGLGTTDTLPPFSRIDMEPGTWKEPGTRDTLPTPPPPLVNRITDGRL